ncbi:MAG: hypothetical protein ACXWLD_11595, partial [Rhizomicrobium sp.]
MRRGLISWSRTELPESVLDGRVARAQAAMAAAKIDALAVYSDPSRTAGASWLSAFVPYWNRGVLIVPKSGQPTLFTGMSNRVHGWIKRNAHLANVTYSTDLGGDVGKFVTQTTPGAVIAVPDISAVPGPVTDGLAASGASVVDGTALLARLRSSADASDLALYFKAASIAYTALCAARATETDAGALNADVEAEARRRGAEEAYIAIAPDLAHSRLLYRLEGAATLGERFAVRASIAYKGSWIRMTRTLARKASDDITQAGEQFAAATALLPNTDGLAKFKAWLIEGCRATQPLEALAGNQIADPIEIAAGAVVSVQATIDMPSGPVLLG